MKMRSLLAAVALAALIAAPRRRPRRPSPMRSTRSSRSPDRAFLGAGFIQALRLVEKQTNATGGIHGRPMKLVIATINRVRKSTYSCSRR